MQKGAELVAESTMDGNSADTGCAENPAQVHPAVGEGLHLAECNQVDTKKVMAAKGEFPFSVTNVNDYMKKFKFDNVHGCRCDLRVFNANCNRTYALQECMQGTQNNAMDDHIRHFDKQIDRDDSENLESILPDDELFFLMINVKDYAMKFKFDNVYSCCLGARVSDAECDHIHAL